MEAIWSRAAVGSHGDITLLKYQIFKNTKYCHSKTLKYKISNKVLSKPGFRL